MATGIRYDKELKLGAVRQVIEEGRSIKEVAAGLGLHENTLYSWVSAAKKHGQTKAFPGSGTPRDLEDENRKLKEQLRIALMERDILKKTIAFFAERPK
ncbi:MAG: transposase [Chlamydiae bacterium]|nr:transposase [Chlamydiota bacterium]